MNVPERPPGLVAERVDLRGVSDADVTPFFAIFSNAEVMRY